MVKRLPLAALISSDILALHRCSLNYVVGKRRRLRFKATDCSVFRENRGDPEQRLAVQGQFVESDVAKKRNRVAFRTPLLLCFPQQLTRPKGLQRP